MNPRLPQLDLLRFFAVILVLWFHFSPDRFAMAGWAGVDLFFVLSGFLVSGLLFAEFKKHGCIRASRFLIRRGLKIYPSFWLLIFISVLMADNTVRPLAVFCELLFLRNYGPGLWMHTWTLCVEEHFYIAIALIFPFMVFNKVSADPFGLIPFWGCTLALMALLFRILTVLFLPLDLVMNTYGSHLRCDGLIFGVIVAYWYHWHYQWLQSIANRWFSYIMFFALLSIMPSFFFSNISLWFRTLGLTFLDLAFAGILLIAVVDTRFGKLIHSSTFLSFLTLIGTFSYSIYLWHPPVALWIVEPIAQLYYPSANIYLIALFKAILSIVLGIVASLLVEMPSLYLRDKFFPSRVVAYSPSQTEQSSLFNSNNDSSTTTGLHQPVLESS